MAESKWTVTVNSFSMYTFVDRQTENNREIWSHRVQEVSIFICTKKAKRPKVAKI